MSSQRAYHARGGWKRTNRMRGQPSSWPCPGLNFCNGWEAEVAIPLIEASHNGCLLTEKTGDQEWSGACVQLTHFGLARDANQCKHHFRLFRTMGGVL